MKTLILLLSYRLNRLALNLLLLALVFSAVQSQELIEVSIPVHHYEGPRLTNGNAQFVVPRQNFTSDEMLPFNTDQLQEMTDTDVGYFSVVYYEGEENLVVLSRNATETFVVKLEYKLSEPTMPTETEILDLMCQTERFFSTRFQEEAGEMISSDAKFIDWSYNDNPDAAFSVAVTFMADSTFNDTGEAVPIQTMSDSLELGVEEIVGYIENYVWITQGVFQDTIAVNFTTYDGTENKPMPDLGLLMTGDCSEVEAGIFALEYGFRLSGGPEVFLPPEDEMIGLVCQTSSFFRERLQSFLDDDALRVELNNISWNFDANATYPLSLNFTANAIYGDGSSVPQDMVLEGIGVGNQEDIMFYIENYVWATNDMSILREVTSVNFDYSLVAADGIPPSQFDRVDCSLAPTMSPSPSQESSFFSNPPTSTDTEPPTASADTSPSSTPSAAFIEPSFNPTTSAINSPEDAPSPSPSVDAAPTVTPSVPTFPPTIGQLATSVPLAYPTTPPTTTAPTLSNAPSSVPSSNSTTLLPTVIPADSQRYTITTIFTIKKESYEFGDIFENLLAPVWFVFVEELVQNLTSAPASRIRNRNLQETWYAADSARIVSIRSNDIQLYAVDAEYSVLTTSPSFNETYYQTQTDLAVTNGTFQDVIDREMPGSTWVIGDPDDVESDSGSAIGLIVIAVLAFLCCCCCCSVAFFLLFGRKKDDQDPFGPGLTGKDVFDDEGKDSTQNVNSRGIGSKNRVGGDKASPVVLNESGVQPKMQKNLASEEGTPGFGSSGHAEGGIVDTWDNEFDVEKAARIGDDNEFAKESQRLLVGQEKDEEVTTEPMVTEINTEDDKTEEHLPNLSTEEYDGALDEDATANMFQSEYALQAQSSLLEKGKQEDFGQSFDFDNEDVEADLNLFQDEDGYETDASLDEGAAASVGSSEYAQESQRLLLQLGKDEKVSQPLHIGAQLYADLMDFNDSASSIEEEENEVGVKNGGLENEEAKDMGVKQYLPFQAPDAEQESNSKESYKAQIW